MGDSGYLTISVDDGHPTDFKSAELLARYAFQATFYIPARNPDRQVMTASQISEIARTFEVGAHTFNHRPLKHASREVARAEIKDGKNWLEDIIGQDTIAFCYPNGKFNSTTVELVKRLGFYGARTCMFNLNEVPENPFVFGVSTHAFSHSVATQIRHALLERNFHGLLNFAFTHRFEQDWAKHFLRAVDFVEAHGGVAHLYFHSWEIEEKGQWSKLENLLKTIAERKKLIRVTNGDLFRRWHAKGGSAVDGAF
jgi:peptidoglycan/xylan/chitin deacetylase (PgdA/CDA1 family)